ncbi:AraC family transcriptional regulator [Maribacter sp. BPC-D8]|uniref:AraC family transcriptional regulator n=1 Tax=Maribacter sp. BPC-D8 TaxID=3053613 RepID=UPI002B47A8D1|nr:AraC family transcriptional regulator [Maribacter sp. BPC-D8]WRI30696.1 AraC family transcriptional regulator [Maribacter sp. BPC-D8]
MKPVVENIGLLNSKQSFHFFKLEVSNFKPFWHYHPELELTLIIKGRGTRFVGNSILPFTVNDLVLLGANLPHNYTSVADNQNISHEAIIIQFPKDIFKSFKECEMLHQLYIDAERGIQFKNPSEKTLQLLNDFDTLSKLQQLSVLIEILDDLYNDNDRNYLSSSTYHHHLASSKTQNKIKSVTSYILENLDKKLTVTIMADRTNMVEQSFCRWFKNAVGHSFITFLNLARIEQACIHLSTSDKLIQAIAFDCGFDSLSHFNRTFKKLKGMSPREYRT